MNNNEHLKRALQNDPELRAIVEDTENSADNTVQTAHAAQSAFLMQLLLLRRTAHLTQAELADKIGMPQSSLARIESGRANPTLKTLLKIADALQAELSLQQRS